MAASGPRGPKHESAEEAVFRARLEAAKRESTIQLLFKAARLLDEEALERVAAARPGQVRLRRSHTSLFPHIALEGTRITELAERLGITKQAVSQLVDDLEALGVVARKPDPEDARARLVAFTELGREGLFEGLAVLRSLEKELSRDVGEKSMEHLRRALLAIVARFDGSNAGSDDGQESPA
jgi:DNA-binding MarR family transcriptional regulator